MRFQWYLEYFPESDAKCRSPAVSERRMLCVVVLRRRRAAGVCVWALPVTSGTHVCLCWTRDGTDERWEELWSSSWRPAASTQPWDTTDTRGFNTQLITNRWTWCCRKQLFNMLYFHVFRAELNERLDSSGTHQWWRHQTAQVRINRLLLN